MIVSDILDKWRRNMSADAVADTIVKELLTDAAFLVSARTTTDLTSPAEILPVPSAVLQRDDIVTCLLSPLTKSQVMHLRDMQAGKPDVDFDAEWTKSEFFTPKELYAPPMQTTALCALLEMDCENLVLSVLDKITLSDEENHRLALSAAASDSIAVLTSLQCRPDAVSLKRLLTVAVTHGSYKALRYLTASNEEAHHAVPFVLDSVGVVLSSLRKLQPELAASFGSVRTWRFARTVSLYPLRLARCVSHLCHISRSFAHVMPVLADIWNVNVPAMSKVNDADHEYRLSYRDYETFRVWTDPDWQESGLDGFWKTISFHMAYHPNLLLKVCVSVYLQHDFTRIDTSLGTERVELSQEAFLVGAVVPAVLHILRKCTFDFNLHMSLEEFSTRFIGSRADVPGLEDDYDNVIYGLNSPEEINNYNVPWAPEMGRLPLRTTTATALLDLLSHDTQVREGDGHDYVHSIKLLAAVLSSRLGVLWLLNPGDKEDPQPHLLLLVRMLVRCATAMLFSLGPHADICAVFLESLTPVFRRAVCAAQCLPEFARSELCQLVAERVSNHTHRVLSSLDLCLEHLLDLDIVDLETNLSVSQVTSFAHSLLLLFNVDYGAPLHSLDLPESRPILPGAVYRSLVHSHRDHMLGALTTRYNTDDTKYDDSRPAISSSGGTSFLLEHEPVESSQLPRVNRYEDAVDPTLPNDAAFVSSLDDLYTIRSTLGRLGENFLAFVEFDSAAIRVLFQDGNELIRSILSPLMASFRLQEADHDAHQEQLMVIDARTGDQVSLDQLGDLVDLHVSDSDAANFRANAAVGLDLSNNNGIESIRALVFQTLAASSHAMSFEVADDIVVSRTYARESPRSFFASLVRQLERQEVSPRMLLREFRVVFRDDSSGDRQRRRRDNQRQRRQEDENSAMDRTEDDVDRENGGPATDNEHSGVDTDFDSGLSEHSSSESDYSDSDGYDTSSTDDSDSSSDSDDDKDFRVETGTGDGVVREFFALLGKVLPKIGIFEQNGNNDAFNWTASPDFDLDDQEARWLGRLLAIALLRENTLVSFVVVHGRVFTWMIDMLQFSAQLTQHSLENLGLTSLQFEYKGTDLVPSTPAVKNTVDFRQTYAEAVAREVVVPSSVRAMVAQVAAGFADVVPVAGRKMLLKRVVEVQERLQGAQRLDVNAMRRHVMWNGQPGHHFDNEASADLRSEEVLGAVDWNTVSRVRQWFFEIVADCEWTQHQKLLQFWSGSPLPPLHGFDPARTLERQSWSVVVLPLSSNLPRAMTCSRMLTLVAYETKEQLEQQLRVAIEHGGTGFEE
ncbi:MAG: hypothetical protein MHM6MM_000982 [Cercozoa sp. M6MM]